MWTAKKFPLLCLQVSLFIETRVRSKKSTAVFTVLALSLLTSCTAQTAKNQYLLAEKLWLDGKYSAAVNEFEKVTLKDPQGPLGFQALSRAATTQMLYLSQYNDAVKKFNRIIDLKREAPSAWEAQKQIGEIYFSKTDQYEQAALLYKKLLLLRPDALEGPEFMFRIAKSNFFLWKFDDSVAGFKDLMKRYPTSTWSEKASYEIGVNYFTRGGKSFQEAIEAFNGFIRSYPSSSLVTQAKFEIASCLEEMDQLDAAYHEYELLKPVYPSPNVIDVKLSRIRERKTQRNR